MAKMRRKLQVAHGARSARPNAEAVLERHARAYEQGQARVARLREQLAKLEEPLKVKEAEFHVRIAEERQTLERLEVSKQTQRTLHASLLQMISRRKTDINQLLSQIVDLELEIVDIEKEKKLAQDALNTLSSDSWNASMRITEKQEAFERDIHREAREIEKVRRWLALAEAYAPPVVVVDAPTEEPPCA